MISSKPLSAMTGAFDAARETSFAQLGSAFVTHLPAVPLCLPYVVGFSEDVAHLLGFDASIKGEPAFADFFCGNTTRDWPSTRLPYASVYSGHQFGVWAGQLGDGRALGLGEIEHTGKRYELQLKGSGRTPYSRMGDGRAVLRSSIREFLCSEAMHHLGIPTTRALCVIGSDASVRREAIETAAVLTRVSPSFIRFGHFEHFYANAREAELHALADYVIERFYPHCREAHDPYLKLFDEIVTHTAELIAQWQAVGFCHGVMNTDNMSIIGLTLDYGPFGFLDGFDANHVCNHSDTQGRYAYRLQPQVAYWNCLCLARALLPILGRQYDKAVRSERAAADAQATLKRFEACFAQAFERRLRDKLGLTQSHPGDEALANRLLEMMHISRADFTITFRQLAHLSKHHARADASVRDRMIERDVFDQWASDYRARLAIEPLNDAQRRDAMNRVNPKYVLRNYLAETAIRRAQEKDFSEIKQLLTVLSHPFDEQPEYEAYAAPPPDWASALEVSCSS